MTPAQHGQSSRLCDRTIAGIDFLRGFFALMVVLAHATRDLRTLRGSQSFGSGTGHWLSATLEQGLLWVIGFFVISGFCIQHSTEASLRATGRVDVGHYARARVTRIYPSYIVALVVAIIALMLRSSDEISGTAVAAALTMSQGMLGCLSSFDNSWSLTNEAFYYLVYGLLLWFTRGDMKRLFVWGTFLSLVLTAGSLVLWLKLGKPGRGVFEFWTIPLQMLIWLGGAALLHFWRPLRAKITPASGLWLLLPLSFAVVYFFYVRMWLDGVRLMTMQVINLAWLPFFALLLLALPHIGSLDRPRVRSWCATFGVLSYPLFLLHLPLQHMLGTLLQPQPWFRQLAAGVQWSTLVIVPVLLCWLLALPLEVRFLAWRRKTLKGA